MVKIRTICLVNLFAHNNLLAKKETEGMVTKLSMTLANVGW